MEIVEVVEQFGNSEKIETVSGYHNISDFKVIEEFVGEKYRRETITENCKIFYEWLKSEFDLQDGRIIILDQVGGKPKDVLPKVPIRFKDIGKKAEQRWSYPAAVQWMRMLWKAGLVRRFYLGYWKNALDGNVTGLKWGVMYTWDS